MNRVAEKPAKKSLEYMKKVLTAKVKCGKLNVA